MDDVENSYSHISQNELFRCYEQDRDGYAGTKGAFIRDVLHKAVQGA